MSCNVMQCNTRQQKSGTARTPVLTRCNEDVAHEFKGCDDVQEEFEGH